MLWMDMGAMICAAMLGGVFGGGMMALAKFHSHKFSMKMLEQYWKSDVEYLKALINDSDKKCECRSKDLAKELYTISVNNPVSKAKNSPKNKGCSPKRHFNHRV